VVPLHNYSGEVVQDSREETTTDLIFRHQRHHTQETFEVIPMEPKINLFLPFWWITWHPPQRVWDSDKMRFSSLNCLEKCAIFETAVTPEDNKGKKEYKG